MIFKAALPEITLNLFNHCSGETKPRQDRNDKNRNEAQQQSQPQQPQPTEPGQNLKDAEESEDSQGEATVSEERTNDEQHSQTKENQQPVAQSVTGFYGDWIVLEGQGKPTISR